MTTPSVSVEPAYPAVSIRGVPTDKVWRLFSAGNYPYFLRMVHEIQEGFCPFCQIDTKLNVPIPGIDNRFWNVWDNPISKLPNQDYQFVIPLRRHATHYTELSHLERIEVFNVFSALDVHFGITGGACVARWGNPLRCARSQEHFHFNYHVPNGTGVVHPWIAKDPAGLERKKLILEAFEVLRNIQESSGCSPEEACQKLPSTEQRKLVENLLTTEGRC